MIKNLLTCLASALFLFGCTTNEYVRITNPILDGYFADPSIVLYES